MATKELRERRRTYRTAYTAYMKCVHELVDASERGEWPSEPISATEEKRFADLTLARQALLDALYAHSAKPKTAADGKF